MGRPPQRRAVARYRPIGWPAPADGNPPIPPQKLPLRAKDSIPPPCSYRQPAAGRVGPPALGFRLVPARSRHLPPLGGAEAGAGIGVIEVARKHFRLQPHPPGPRRLFALMSISMFFFFSRARGSGTGSRAPPPCRHPRSAVAMSPLDDESGAEWSADLAGPPLGDPSQGPLALARPPHRSHAGDLPVPALGTLGSHRPCSTWWALAAAFGCQSSRPNRPLLPLRTSALSPFPSLVPPDP